MNPRTAKNLSTDRPRKSPPWKRMLGIAIGWLVAMGVMLLLVDGWWRDAQSFVVMWGTMALLMAVPFAVSAALVWGGTRLRRGGRRWGTALVAVGVAAFIAAGSILITFGGWAGPWWERIVKHGTLPNGHEYVLSQAWVDWYDGYDIRIFFRETDGEWVSLCGGHWWKPFRRVTEIQLYEPEGAAGIRTTRGGEWLLRGHRTVHPAETTPEELHAFHRAEMANLRAGKKRSGEAPQGGAP
jgi:hypothetical protein